MSDPLIEFAEELAKQLQQQFPVLAIGESELDVLVEWTDDDCLDLADAKISAPLVQVIDFAETDASDAGQDFTEYEILVVTQLKIPNNLTANQVRRAMSGLVADIRQYLRPIDGTNELIIGEGETALNASCMKTERKPAVDPEDWRVKRRFFNILTTTWRVYR